MQKHNIIYDKIMQIIWADGENVVDLSSVEDGTTAILHSRAPGEDAGFEVTFRFEANEQSPFCLGFANLSPVTLIRAIVENRLQLNGLKYSPEIDQVYSVVKGWTIDDIFTTADIPSPLHQH